MKIPDWVVKTEYDFEVLVESASSCTYKSEKQEANSLAALVNSLKGVRARVAWKTEYRCPLCKLGWELDADGEPACCEEAQKKMRGDSA